MDANTINEDNELDTEMKQIEVADETDHFSIYSPFRVDAADQSKNENFWADYLLKIAQLPESIQDILTSIETINFLLDISEDYDLSDDQSAEVSRIIRETMFGNLFINDVPMAISQKLNVDQQVAQQITSKIVSKLFAPAIEDIKKVQREKFPDSVGRGSTSAMPQPPAPPQMKNTPPVNQSNVIDLRNQS